LGVLFEEIRGHEVFALGGVLREEEVDLGGRRGWLGEVWGGQEEGDLDAASEEDVGAVVEGGALEGRDLKAVEVSAGAGEGFKEEALGGADDLGVAAGDVEEGVEGGEVDVGEDLSGGVFAAEEGFVLGQAQGGDGVCDQEVRGGRGVKDEGGRLDGGVAEGRLDLEGLIRGEVEAAGGGGDGGDAFA
jgi:hypothetical protein